MDRPHSPRVPAEMLSLQEALVLMRSRWQIEKLFELWKRYGHLDKSRSEKPWRVMCEIHPEGKISDPEHTG